MIVAPTETTTRSAVKWSRLRFVLVWLVADLSLSDVTFHSGSEVETGSRLLCVVSGMFLNYQIRKVLCLL